MTTETFTPPTSYVIDGIGPYPVGHEYNEGALTCIIYLNGVLTPLTAVDFSASPTASETSGNVYLSEVISAAYDTGDLYIIRNTNAEQGWLGIGGAREASLEKQVDRISRAVQELQNQMTRTFRVPFNLPEIEFFINNADERSGRVIIFDEDGNPYAGPTGADIENAQANAAQVALDRAAVEAVAAISNVTVKNRADLAGLTYDHPYMTSGVLVTVRSTGEIFEALPLVVADPDLAYNVPLNIVPQDTKYVALEALDDGRDHDALFARAIAKFRRLALASAITLTTPIMVQADMDLLIDGGNITYTGDSVMLRQDGDVDIHIKGTNGAYVVGPDNASIAVAQMGYSGLVEIDGIIAFNIHPYATGTDGFTYATVTEADMVGGVRLNNIIAMCSTGASTAAAITIRYTDGAWVSNVEMHGYRHGIQWWGGDSNPAENGAPANERKCRNIYIDNCHVYDSASTSTAYSGGGIWGSMGELIFLTRCHATGCHDVGIDFEGCFNSSATNCSARDNVNGNFTTFFNCRTITIENSFSFQRYGQAHYRAYNSSLNPENQRRISLINMHYEAFDGGDGATDFPTIDTNNGPVDGLRLIGGTYVNSVIKIAVSNSSNGGAVEIKDPYFEINAVPEHSTEDPFSLVYCKGMSVGWFRLSGLKLRAYVSIPAGAYLADIRATDFNKVITFVIEDINDADLTSGRSFTGGVRFTAAGSNSGVHPIVFLRNNRCAAMSIVNAGVGTAVVKEHDNYNMGGGVLTATIS